MWYRFTKVLYVLSFLFAIIISLLVFAEQGYSNIVDIDKSKIVCQFGNKKTFLIKDIFDNPKFDILDILILDKDEKAKVTKICEINRDELIKSGVWIIGPDGQIQAKVFDMGFYAGVIEYRTEIIRNKEYNFAYLFIFFLILSILFEAGRRVFYYIALGTFNPKE
jgi:hypothetical protein